jgi:hypothetical protein
MKQRSVPRRRSGKLRRLQMQEGLYILYDVYLHETGYSFQSLTTGTDVATSNDEHLHLIHYSVGNCMRFGLTTKGEETCTMCSGMLCVEVRLATPKMKRSQVKPQECRQQTDSTVVPLVALFQMDGTPFNELTELGSL